MFPRAKGCLVLSILMAAPLGATVLLPATLEELAEHADAIVYARVASVSSRQAASTLRVERLVELDVVRYLKGSGGPSVTLHVPGGTFGRYRTVTPGSPELAAGEEAVFFIGARGAAGPWLVGLGQGVLRVSLDEASGRRVVRSPILSSDEGPVRRGDSARRPVPLAELEGRLAAAVIAQRARRERAR
jgi:hypothetical protein